MKRGTPWLVLAGVALPWLIFSGEELLSPSCQIYNRGCQQMHESGPFWVLFLASTAISGVGVAMYFVRRGHPFDRPPQVSTPEPHGSAGAAAYWAVAGFLIGFGLLGMFSIGLPFLLLGIMLIALAPLRSRQTLFWAGLAGVLMFIAATILVAPWGCTTSSTSSRSEPVGSTINLDLSRTVCTNPLGIDYSGSDGYSPAYWPALFSGVAAGLVAATATGVILARRKSEVRARR